MYAIAPLPVVTQTQHLAESNIMVEVTFKVNKSHGAPLTNVCWNAYDIPSSLRRQIARAGKPFAQSNRLVSERSWQSKFLFATKQLESSTSALNPAAGKIDLMLERTRPPRRPGIACAFFALVFIVVALIRVEACPVCFLVPQTTAADYLIESEFVVLAREDPDRPFSYSSIEILKGPETNDEFDLFVDSTTRRLLKANPKRAVVLVRKSRSEPWQSLGIADHPFQEVVRRILAFATAWSKGDDTNARYKFFLSLLGSENRAIFELAYLELGRAPYDTIKKMAKYVSPAELRPILSQREYFQWRPLAILFLAQDPTDQDRELIESSFENSQKFRLTTNLAAWATAHVEINGAQAVEQIEEKYFGDSSRSVKEIRAVVIALSVHGNNGHTHLRDRIVASYGVALQNHPQVAGLIASDLSDWRKNVYCERMIKIIKNPELELDAMEIRAIKLYLR